MKALYSRSFLEHIAYEDMCVAFIRYFFKLERHRKEIAELKFHEKDFLFRALQVFYNATGDKRFNVNRIPELEEQLFYWVILLHSNMTMVFDGFVPGPNKTSLTPKEKRRNKHFFYEYLQVWKNQCKKQVFDQQFSEKLISADFGKLVLHIVIDKAVMRQRAAASLLGA